MSQKLVPKFYCDVKNGKITLQNAQKFNLHIQSLKEGTYELLVKPPIKESTDPQRRYYHGVICKIIADETGHTPDEVHEFLAWEFLQIPDQKIRVRRSTGRGDLSTVEREEYHRKCREWASTTLNVYVPLPNEVDIPLYF